MLCRVLPVVLFAFFRSCASCANTNLFHGPPLSREVPCHAAPPRLSLGKPQGCRAPKPLGSQGECPLRSHLKGGGGSQKPPQATTTTRDKNTRDKNTRQKHERGGLWQVRGVAMDQLMCCKGQTKTTYWLRRRASSLRGPRGTSGNGAIIPLCIVQFGSHHGGACGVSEEPATGGVALLGLLLGQAEGHRRVGLDQEVHQRRHLPHRRRRRRCHRRRHHHRRAPRVH